MLDPAVFDEDLDKVLADLAPACGSSASRALAVFNSAYRTRRKQMAALFRGPAPSAAEMVRTLTAARDLSNSWRIYAVDAGRPRLPADLAGSRAAYEQLSAGNHSPAVSRPSTTRGTAARIVGNSDARSFLRCSDL